MTKKKKLQKKAQDRLLLCLNSRQRIFFSLFFFSFLEIFCACTRDRQDYFLNKAEEAIEKEEYKKSISYFQSAFEANPTAKQASRALFKLGFVHEMYLKQHKTAIFYYNKLLDSCSDQVSCYEVKKRMASIYFEFLFDFDEAISVYRKLILDYPEGVEVDFFSFRVGQSLFSKNQFELSRVEYQKILEKFPQSSLLPRIRFEIGNTYYMEGKYTVAQDALKQVVRKFPDSPYAKEALFLIAQCYEHQEKLKDALEIYEKQLQGYEPKRILALKKQEITRRISSLSK